MRVRLHLRTITVVKSRIVQKLMAFEVDKVAIDLVKEECDQMYREAFKLDMPVPARKTRERKSAGGIG